MFISDQKRRFMRMTEWSTNDSNNGWNDNYSDNAAEEWFDLSKVRLLSGERVSNINQIIEILNHSILMSSI